MQTVLKASDAALNSLTEDAKAKKALYAEKTASYNALSTEKARASAKIMTPEKIKEAEDFIASADRRIAAAGIVNEANSAKAELETITQKEARLAELDRQIASNIPDIDRPDVNVLLAQKEAAKARMRASQEYETYQKLIRETQLQAEQEKARMTRLKKIGSVLLECKESIYSFIDDMCRSIEETMGYKGIVGNSGFGMDKDGIMIQEDVLSGGERVIYYSAMIAMVMQFAQGIRLLEIEGGELDQNNLKKLATFIKGKVDISIITHPTTETYALEGVNVIQL